ncbi:precorrin-2 dehydrogenase / sirohydrochlorin ferrochelatase [Thermosyntropha lipolytica DSM 11003]|uniref:precorrin-2 dehydrogenase n=1 Tax=Thermosyntropha lipolytica DSM 11003 TaxID=1123382 RepID=A0A1M5NJL9_9FIRM|nr:bifunctional precorrin-2 dehydrogenase/sirohydrochlorin ferrochelatase [Thermosyntropha lipolytica]SHG89721.1 precorrin-2 dehydrogenase / sirohydrochlorin ferrochelatase [Thermosyntropha lipolytica DSM 11003]
MAHLFPAFINLEGKNCLIIGGGKVAERKVANLLAYGTNIKVVSPKVTENIKEWGEKGLITVNLRAFDDRDLDGIFMVFAATNDSDLNRRVARICRMKGILLNAVDDPVNCDFYVPSVVRRDSLVVAISTEGKSPLFARKMREELEGLIPEAYGWYVDLLGEVREKAKAKINDINEREALFHKLVNDEILGLLRKGEWEKVKERVEECISSLQD